MLHPISLPPNKALGSPPHDSEACCPANTAVQTRWIPSARQEGAEGPRCQAWEGRIHLRLRRQEGNPARRWEPATEERRLLSLGQVGTLCPGRSLA